MKTTSISELKAKLSEQLSYVEGGESIVITNRGRPVARLVPIGAQDRTSDVLMELERAGLLRRSLEPLRPTFFDAHRPADPQGLARRAALEERRDSW